jgi:Na+/melibiose symporter-like transporter
VDAAEARTGVRNDGISFATLTFTAKVMSALATAVFGLVVVIAGYQSDLTVTRPMQDVVWVGITLVPAVSSLLSAVPFLFYRLNVVAESAGSRPDVAQSSR